MTKIVVALGVVAVSVVVIACSSSDTSPGSSSGSSGSSSGSSGSSSGTDGGGNTDPDATLPSGDCDATCQKMTLKGDFGEGPFTFDHAHFGLDGTGVYVEAYSGGPTDCPTSSSPTPDHTFILAAEGGSTFFDFKGDVLTGKPVEKATSTQATGQTKDSATPPAWYAVDVTSAFTGGTITGHVYATYCESLSK